METTIEVQEASQVAEVRRAAAELARAEQMSETEAGLVALVATEMSTNLVKYASRGTVTLSRYSDAAQRGVELVALDHGPGFADLAAALRDGHSTGGSLGVGLGSIQRAASCFDIYSVAGQGTAVLARMARARTGRADAAIAPSLVAAARCVPMRGHVECGDAWAMRDFGRKQLICIVDGLGHGPMAAVAATRALEVFDAAHHNDTPAEILQAAHEGLKNTRGAVMAVLALDSVADTAVFCGAGNITAVILHEGASQHLLSVEGTAGYNVRKFRSQQASWAPKAVAILNTDGLSARMNQTKYPGLLARHPSLIASVLFRDHARDTDDATIVVARRT
jgi:anti-sigma regulatory factor (Ser/Thr protein kinase)